MIHFWILFCRSVLEQSCVLWHSSLTQENSDDLERTQKTFIKLLLKEEYKEYDEALLKLNFEKLSDTREKLSINFSKDGLKFDTLSDLLKKKEKKHIMETRKSEHYEVDFSNTERMKRSSVVYFQNLLNNEHE